MKDLKNNKKIIIIGLVLLIIILSISIYFIFFSNSSNNESLENNNEDKIIAPASDTEELLSEMNVVEIQAVTEDEIIFTNDLEVEENDRVALWIYSEPKFLGYFKVIFENGIKKIIGLEKALENISIKPGDHNIAITTESGESIGYIDVYIKEDGKISDNDEATNAEIEEPTTKKSETTTTKKKTTTTTTKKSSTKTTTKEITEKESINYETTKQEDVNMLKGTTKVTQEGQNGEKTITYKITYDESGKEISREKIKETTTKEPINEIKIIGTSDFNMNKDMLTEISFGPMCTELTTNEYGDKGCNEGTLEYVAIKINTTEYITSIKENGKNIFNGLIKVSESDGINLIATYNGTKYYFYKSAGGGQYELLNEETCSKYGLKCGRW